MKMSIRNGVFETNSSSTHSICYMSEYDLDEFLAGKFYIAAGDEDWGEGRRMTQDEYDNLMRSYVEDERSSEDTAWYSYSYADLETLFPLRYGIADGRKLVQMEQPIYDWLEKQWWQNVTLPGESSSEGHVSMGICKEEDDPLERMKMEFEFYQV